MSMTKAEAEAELLIVNAAISDLIQGKRITQLQVRSANFQRLYGYQEITLEGLKAYRDELLGIINSLTDELPTFRKNTTIPLIVKKDRF